MLRFMGLQRVGHDRATELNCVLFIFIYLLIYSVLLVMLPSEIPELPTDPTVRGFPGVWKLLLF